MAAVDQLRELVKQFEAVANKHGEFGATDTEPDGIFQSLLMKAANGKPVHAPTTVDEWELYDGMRGGNAAASALGQKAQACVDFILNVSIGESEPVRKYLVSYCWRA